MFYTLPEGNLAMFVRSQSLKCSLIIQFQCTVSNMRERGVDPVSGSGFDCTDLLMKLVLTCPVKDPINATVMNKICMQFCHLTTLVLLKM